MASSGSVLSRKRFALDSVSTDQPVELPGSGLEAPAVLSQLSSSASRFLNALRDVGYLDDVLEDEVLDLVMTSPDGNVSLDDIRYRVASVLFDRQQELDHETLQLLQEEWRLVFH